MSATQQTTRIAVSGLDCADCARTLESAIAGLPGVNACSVQFATGNVLIEHDGRPTRGQIADQVERLGYRMIDRGTATSRRTFEISGMDCADCAQALAAAVRLIPGVEQADVDFATGRLTVAAPSDTVTSGAIAETASRLGFRAHSAESPPTEPIRPAWLDRRNVELAVAAGMSLTAIGLSLTGGPEWIQIAMHLVAAVLAGYPVARAALTSIRVRRADMNLLMTIAAVGAIALQDWTEASTLMVLFGVGLALQSASIDRTRGAIRALLQVAPTSARIRRGDGYESIAVADVRPGDEVDVQSGERVPVDGVVMAGISSVDQSFLTGESIPLAVEPGGNVLAGSINGESRLLVRSTSTGSDSTVSRIIELVEHAHASKAPSLTLVERFATIYTPVVIAGALLIAALGIVFSGVDTEWLYRGLVLLVVACPCALVISTPVAFVSALGRASKMGVLFKGGLAVESLGKVRQVSFDKTGTLTHGRPEVTSIHAADGVTTGRVITMAAALEAGANHPIARGIVRAAGRIQLPDVTDLGVIPGRGLRGRVGDQVVTVGAESLFGPLPNNLQMAAAAIRARGETAVLVGVDESVVGVIGVADTIRPAARSVVSRLRAMHVRTQLLSGDAGVVALKIGADAGVDEVKAELLPGDKVAEIVRAQERWPVAMVGDGINDAPALSVASVGIAMGASGTAVAIEAADVALMSDDLTQVPRAVALARATRAVILQNIAFALASKLAFIGLTATGYTSLWLAVVADVGASLLVTFNALRLLKVDLD